MYRLLLEEEMPVVMHCLFESMLMVLAEQGGRDRVLENEDYWWKRLMEKWKREVRDVSRRLVPPEKPSAPKKSWKEYHFGWDAQLREQWFSVCDP